MTEHAANGVYDGAAITTWERGSSAAVIWKADGKHRGTSADASLTEIMRNAYYAVI